MATLSPPAAPAAHQTDAGLRPASHPGFGGHLPALDGLRGLAILLVMVFHFTPILPAGSPSDLWLLRVCAAGWCGVDLFFVLSGFLITGILLDARSRAGYFRNFYARRALRIFPLYYGTLFVVFVIYPPVVRDPSAEFEQLSKQQAWLWAYCTNVREHLAGEWTFNIGLWSLNGFWSLAVEEHFYLVWPLLVLLLGGRRLVALCGVLILAALALRIALVATGQPAVSAYTLTPCRMDGLALGALLAAVVRWPTGLASLRRWAPRLALVAGVALLSLFVWRGGLKLADPIVQTAGYSLLAVFFAALLVLSLTASPASFPGRFLTAGAMRFLGKYSYGLYVFHCVFRSVFQYWFPAQFIANATGSLPLTTVLSVATGIAACVPLAWLSWHLCEKHFLKLKRFFECREQVGGPSRRDRSP